MMNRTRLTLATLALMAGLFATGSCSRHAASSTRVRRPLAELPSPVTVSVLKPLPAYLIGTLRGREYVIRIYAGARYTVRDAAGRTLAEFVTKKELQASLPDIHRDLERMFAQGGSWAGL